MFILVEVYFVAVFAFVDKDGKESAESPGKLLGLSVTIGWFRGLSDCKC